VPHGRHARIVDRGIKSMASNASAGAYCASAFAPVTALAPLDVALRAAKKC